MVDSAAAIDDAIVNENQLSYEAPELTATTPPAGETLTAATPHAGGAAGDKAAAAGKEMTINVADADDDLGGPIVNAAATAKKKDVNSTAAYIIGDQS